VSRTPHVRGKTGKGGTRGQISLMPAFPLMRRIVSRPGQHSTVQTEGPEGLPSVASGSPGTALVGSRWGGGCLPVDSFQRRTTFIATDKQKTAVSREGQRGGVKQSRLWVTGAIIREPRYPSRCAGGCSRNRGDPYSLYSLGCRRTTE
jgi:hypothetical protein